MFDIIYVIKYAKDRTANVVDQTFTSADEAQNYANARFDDDYLIVELNATDIFLAMNGLY